MAAISSSRRLPNIAPIPSLNLQVSVITDTSVTLNAVQIPREIDFSSFYQQSWKYPICTNVKEERNFISPFTFNGVVDDSTINLFVKDKGYLVYLEDGLRKYSSFIELKEKYKFYVISSSTLASIKTLPIDENLRFQLTFDPPFFRTYLDQYIPWGQANVFKAMIRIEKIFVEFSKLPASEAFQARSDFLEGVVRSRISFLFAKSDLQVFRQSKKNLTFVCSEKPLKGFLSLTDTIIYNLSSYLSLKENAYFQQICKFILNLKGPTQLCRRSNFWESMLEAIKLKKKSEGPEGNVIRFLGQKYHGIIPLVKKIQMAKNKKDYKNLRFLIESLISSMQKTPSDVPKKQFLPNITTAKQRKEIEGGKAKTICPDYDSERESEVLKKQLKPLYPLFIDPTKTIFEAIDVLIQGHRYHGCIQKLTLRVTPINHSITIGDELDPSMGPIHYGTTMRRIYQWTKRALLLKGIDSDFVISSHGKIIPADGWTLGDYNAINSEFYIMLNNYQIGNNLNRY